MALGALGAASKSLLGFVERAPHAIAQERQFARTCSFSLCGILMRFVTVELTKLFHIAL